jgi:iron complex outermembrane receptor protein
MSSVLFRRSLLAVACGLSAAPVLAQSVGSTANPANEIVITGNPLGRDAALGSVGSLSNADLRERGQSSLGETLSGLPGVSSTYFGPQASRPVVRGLDGERVRVLSNSSASQDVSALSYDHAVPSDVLSADRVEVLRGPAALLYGGSAMGGVVNVLDNRIPREAIESLQGRVQVQGASGNLESSAAALLEGGDGAQAWHVDAFERRSGDVRVPNAAGRIPNSDSHTRGGALGWSHFGGGARLGLSASTWRSDYGTVAEDHTRIGMHSDKLALEGEWREPLAGWQQLKLQAGVSDYGHTEFEAGVAGTVFAKRGQDLRLQARHQPLGPIEGVVGLQLDSARFKVDGAEAFMPYTQSRSQALFALEEWRTGWGQVQTGARLEQVALRSDGSPTSSLPFVLGERRFDPRSYSLGAQYRLAGDWQASGQLAHSERAPGDAELFANGPHMATHTWELGNANLGLEKSNSVELGLERRGGLHPMKFSMYDSRFDNFIGLMGLGSAQGGLPEYAYTGVQARLRGWEASGQSRILQSVLQDQGALDLHWHADRVLADNLSSGEPLPRIAPWRAGLSAVYRQGAWQARLGFDHAAAQQRVPEGSTPTASYTLWHAGLNYRQKVGTGSIHWFARLDNIGNALAYSATSILTSTVPGRVPLPGRSIKLGMQWQF